MYNFEERKKILQERREMKRPILELEKWFIWYDSQVAQYNRAVRMNQPFDRDINALDSQAKVNAEELKRLRMLVS